MSEENQVIEVEATPVPVKRGKGNPNIKHLGFVKGDPRINRKGRPPHTSVLRKALLEKLDETALDKVGNPIVKNGKKVTRLDVLIDKMLSDPRCANMVLDRAFGKVKDEVEINGSMEHLAAPVDLGALDLDRETQRKILDAMRRKNERE